MLTFPVPEPDPTPTGIGWLRSTVSRFANGAVHARRRAIVEDLLAGIDPAELSRPYDEHPVARLARALGFTGTAEDLRVEGVGGAAGEPRVGGVGGAAEDPRVEGVGGAAEDPRVEGVGGAAEEPRVGGVGRAAKGPRVGGAATDLRGEGTAAGVRIEGIVEDVRIAAAAYQTGDTAADEAVERLVAAFGGAHGERTAARIQLLVQACDATATLIERARTRPVDEVLRDDPPVLATRRVAPDGSIVAVPLAGRPFGEGPRACPGREHALALVEGALR
ncbi:hypothetical protein ACQP2P_09720 [Dactylosporangium sp. CA-139114]|uniref:hypothetical protein n=1 Tax=Dactylosporangium sp. CA-139114 TaxID=3239931 RepID=UPI003D9960F1